MCAREEHQEPISEEGQQDRRSPRTHSFKMYVAQCHHPPLMGMYTMYHSLMIILVKDLDIFEVFNKIKEFKALIREPFCKED
jgi:transcription antitermination factor NusA-like protein